jgi:ParB family chromosome partitioning protein
MGHARVLAGLTISNDQKSLRDMIINKGLSVRQAEALAKKIKAPKRGKRRESELDAYTRSLADNLKRSLGTKVEIKKKGRGGQIIVYYYSDEELDRLLELLE